MIFRFNFFSYLGSLFLDFSLDDYFSEVSEGTPFRLLMVAKNLLYVRK